MKNKKSSVRHACADPDNFKGGGGGGGGGGGVGIASSSFSSRKYMITCNFPGGGLGPLPPAPSLSLPISKFQKQFEFTIVRHFRDFLYQRVLGDMYCRAWSIHKPSANYIS